MVIRLFEGTIDRVVKVTVNKPYPGKTSFGVGLGSSRKMVRWTLGSPGYVGEYKPLDTYFSGDTVAMAFLYDSTDHVQQIIFGGPTPE
jgi:hypothetical protein